MRVGLDLTSLIAKPTGVDRYLLGMAASLARLETGDDYVAFINTEDRERVAAVLPEGARVSIVAACNRQRAARLFFQQILLPLFARSMRLDVIHSPTFIMPMHRANVGHLLTIHDMTSFLAPENHPASRRGRLYEAAVRASARRADLISVPSASVRSDVLRLTPDLPADRVRSIPCGVDDVFVPHRAADIAPVLARLGVHEPYILYVGTLDPRKNLPRLLEAFERLVTAGRPERLVLAGQPGWSVDALRDRLQAPALRGRVQLLGYVDEVDLPFLYGGARLFAYPSLLEGFGFPPLEAMACGVPVVVSRSSSLQDNLAGAADLVPPEDVGALTAAMEALLSDEARRSRQIAAGLERAATFRWDNFARATSACYHDIVAARSRAARS